MMVNAIFPVDCVAATVGLPVRRSPFAHVHDGRLDRTAEQGIRRSNRMGASAKVKTRRTQDLDPIDRQILAILEVDWRRPTADIARAVGLTGPAVSDRIARMRDKGVIAGFTVKLDPMQLGLNISAIVEFGAYSNADAVGIAAVVGHPAVRSCYKVTGPGLLILIVHASDGAELHDILLDFSSHGSTKTSIILSSDLAELPFFAERPKDVIGVLLKKKQGRGHRPRAARG
jgi:Lrp/AsnC family leucine-responsive transcriptional regulator